MLYKCFVFAGQEDFLPNIVHFSNVGSMLGQRRRRWPNIKTALGECLVGWVSRWSSIQSCKQVTESTTLYSMLQAYTHASSERDSIFNQFKEWFNCKTRMPGMVKCRPTVAYWVQIDGNNIATELITRYYLNGTLIQCCFNARPTSATLAQHWTNIE